nr:hypothetical protein [Neobacillus sp. Marseille-Q6967]
MVPITRTQEVAEVLAGIDHKLVPKWIRNDLIKKNIAISYDYWLEDTEIPITLNEYVLQYLEHAQFLGEMFLTDLKIHELEG